MHTSSVTTYSLSSSNTEFQGGFQNSADLIDSSTTTFVAEVDEGYSSSCYFGERNVACYLKMDVVDGGEKKDAMMKETEEEEEEEEEEDHQRTKNEDDGDRSEEEVVVRWERYLPRMAVRVLLVEADHSTRHIITALLRKCSYSVTAVSDGLKAWETLKSKATDLDLILTEVELPSISGFALLTLIMEHDVCKNIPVIMMSSHDSVSMVLKCMLKGAADFLIKPVRRNELRNLWQHVWRRHATSMPPQNTTFPPEKLTIASQDNSSSNQSSGSVASSQKNNECCENLIEAQSACASPFLKVENTCMENMQDASQLKSSLNLSNTDVVQYEESTKIESKSAKHNDETGDRSVEFVSEAASCNKTLKTTDLRLEQGHCSAETEGQDEVLRAELSKANSNCNTKIQGCSGKPSRAIDLMATFENLEKPANENCSLNGGNTTKFDIDSKLELTLRRGYSNSSCKQTSEATEEKQILNPSNTSAFSRYSGNSKLLQPLLSTPSVNSAKENSIDWNSQKSHRSSGNTLDTSCQYGGTSKNQVNMTTLVLGGQIGPKLSTSKCGLLPVTGVTSDIKAEGHGNVFTSGSYAQSGVHPIWNPKPACQKEGSPFPTSASSQSNQSHNLEQPHCLWSCDAAYTSLNQNVHDKSNLDEVGHDSSAAGQSAGNILCHDGGIRKNSSAHESIGSASDGNATSTVVAKNNPENLSESGRCNYDGFRGTNSHRSSQREAALTKFRLKRKERCYEKKVRYQSRKTLAEQRPRVKGQFVRQVQHDHPVADANGDS